MDDTSLLLSLGVVRPSPRSALSAFEDAFPDAAPRPGSRRRIFDERATVGLMLGQALNRNDPCKSAVRRVQVEFGMAASSSTAAYCKARARVRPETLATMSAKLSSEADRCCGLADFTGVRALDGTTFQASDTDANRAEWPYAGEQKPGCGFPVVGALMAHSLVGGGSAALAIAPWKAHDFRLYVEASSKFKEGELHTGDRAFCSVAALAILKERGSDGIFRGKEWCRKSRPGDVRIGDGDWLATWPRQMVRRSATLTDEQFARLPEKLTVRVITARIVARGFRDEEIVIVTSLLDPVRYPKEQILEWYLRRWEIEVSFRDMKTTLRYEFIRGRTPHVVKLEIGILLLAYNLMRYVIARGRNGKAKPSCGIASTAAAVKAFLDVVQSVFRAGRSLARAFARLIALVVSDKLKRRKRRPNVRAVKRRPKPYRLLMKPRNQYTPEECV